MLVEMVGDGRHRVAADGLLDRIAAPDPPTLVTAPHALAEAMNALRRLESRAEITSGEALRAVDQLGRFDLVTDPMEPRRARIWSLRHVMTVYDAAYAASAEALDAPLLSVDARLIRACQANGIVARYLDELAA